MLDILDYLEELTQPDATPPEYSELLKELGSFTKTVQEHLSLEFLDDLGRAQVQITQWECREAFSRGFRLGAQIILALAPPSAPDTHHRSWERQ